MTAYPAALLGTNSIVGRVEIGAPGYRAITVMEARFTSG